MASGRLRAVLAGWMQGASGELTSTTRERVAMSFNQQTQRQARRGGAFGSGRQKGRRQKGGGKRGGRQKGPFYFNVGAAKGAILL